jgi:hypothetical protein
MIVHEVVAVVDETAIVVDGARLVGIDSDQLLTA